MAKNSFGIGEIGNHGLVPFVIPEKNWKHLRNPKYATDWSGEGVPRRGCPPQSELIFEFII